MCFVMEVGYWSGQSHKGHNQLLSVSNYSLTVEFRVYIHYQQTRNPPVHVIFIKRVNSPDI